MRGISRLIGSDAAWSPAAARVILGLVMFPHGAQKVFGWFGGDGISGTLQFLASLGVPAPVAILVIIAEFGGSLALIVGAIGRVAAAGIIGVMLGAILTIHHRNGFFMDWSGSGRGEGYEYHLLAIGLATVILIGGSGIYSIDRFVSRSAEP